MTVGVAVTVGVAEAVSVGVGVSDGVGVSVGVGVAVNGRGWNAVEVGGARVNVALGAAGVEVADGRSLNSMP